MRRLRRAELPIGAAQLARYLIGKVLVHETSEGRMTGRIVETEAYEIGDAAAHSFRGQTSRNRSLFLKRGHAYVYFIYGNWFAMNVSAEVAGVGGGVLLRALEPLEGIELMARRRPHSKPEDMTRGPGRLATAFGIDRTLDGVDLCQAGPLWLAEAPHLVGKIGKSVRIGITLEAHRLLRFFEIGNPLVSGPKHLSLHRTPR